MIEDQDKELKESFIAIDRSKLNTWLVNQKTQGTIYEAFHNSHSANIYKQNGTSERIHSKEVQFLEEQIQQAMGKVKVRRQSVVNIPSGSGRLNDLLSKFYGQITCVDACSQALINIKKKPNLAQVIQEKNYIQDYQFRVKFDAIFCNYGVSYLNLNQLYQFFAKVKEGLKKEGLLIMKEVYQADEHWDAIYSETQKRIFLTEDQYKVILSDLSSDFEILANLQFVPNRQMYPEKFLILRRK